MSETVIASRDEIPSKYTWNAPSVFESREAWEAEFASLAESIDDFSRFKGHLADGSAALADALDALEALRRRIGKVFVYASMSYSVDMTDQAASGISGKARGLWARMLADVLDCAVRRNRQEEVTSLGAAMLAGVGVGLFRDVSEATARMVGWKEQFDPDPNRSRFYAEIFEKVYIPLLKATVPLCTEFAGSSADEEREGESQHKAGPIAASR